MTPNMHRQDPQHDLQLDRILSAIGTAEPTPHMHQRLSASLEAHPQTHRISRRQRFLYTTIPATAAILLITTLTTHRHSNNITITATNASPTTSVISTEAKRSGERGAEVPVFTPARLPATSHVPLTHNPLTHAPLPGTPRLASQTWVPTAPSAPQPVDDAFLPSQPAPIQPPTHDELMLRRMARPTSPNLLAELQPMRDLAHREAALSDARRREDQALNALLAPLVVSEHLQPQPEDANDTPATTNTNTPDSQENLNR